MKKQELVEKDDEKQLTIEEKWDMSGIRFLDNMEGAEEEEEEKK